MSSSCRLDRDHFQVPQPLPFPLFNLKTGASIGIRALTQQFVAEMFPPAPTPTLLNSKIRHKMEIEAIWG